MSGRDSHGTTWLLGWRQERKLARRLERRRRERDARQLEEEQA